MLQDYHRTRYRTQKRDTTKRNSNIQHTTTKAKRVLNNPNKTQDLKQLAKYRYIFNVKTVIISFIELIKKMDVCLKRGHQLIPVVYLYDQQESHKNFLRNKKGSDIEVAFQSRIHSITSNIVCDTALFQGNSNAKR